MGCGCFTIKKKSSFSYKHTEKKLCLKRNMVFSINSWNIVLDFLTYKELNSTAKLCRYNYLKEGNFYTFQGLQNYC